MTDYIYEVRGTNDPIDGDKVVFSNKQEALEYADGYKDAEVYIIELDIDDFNGIPTRVDEIQIRGPEVSANLADPSIPNSCDADNPDCYDQDGNFICTNCEDDLVDDIDECIAKDVTEGCDDRRGHDPINRRERVNFDLVEDTNTQNPRKAQLEAEYKRLEADYNKWTKEKDDLQRKFGKSAEYPVKYVQTQTNGSGGKYDPLDDYDFSDVPADKVNDAKNAMQRLHQAWNKIENILDKKREIETEYWSLKEDGFINEGCKLDEAPDRYGLETDDEIEDTYLSAIEDADKQRRHAYADRDKLLNKYIIFIDAEKYDEYEGYVAYYYNKEPYIAQCIISESDLDDDFTISDLALFNSKAEAETALNKIINHSNELCKLDKEPDWNIYNTEIKQVKDLYKNESLDEEGIFRKSKSKVSEDDEDDMTDQEFAEALYNALAAKREEDAFPKDELDMDPPADDVPVVKCKITPLATHSEDEKPLNEDDAATSVLDAAIDK